MDSTSSEDNKLFVSNIAHWMFWRFLAVLLIIFIASCDKTEQSIEETPSTPPPEPISDLTQKAWDHYHIHAVDIFSQPVACIATAKQAITQLIQEPDEALLDTARSYIKSCRDIYKATALFIAASDNTQQELNKLHQRINAPLEMPGFIDSVQGYPFSGIVNDTSMPLNKKELLRQHGLTGASDVSLGFSVLDFLLWGETIYDAHQEPRPLDSFIAVTEWQASDVTLGLSELDINEHSNNRRRKYIELAILILESDLNQLASVWNKNTFAPSNKDVSESIKERTKDKFKNLFSSPIDTHTFDIIFSLFADNPETGKEVAATSFSQWLEIDDHEAFKTLLDDEAPKATKQKALETIFTLEKNQSDLET